MWRAGGEGEQSSRYRERRCVGGLRSRRYGRKRPRQGRRSAVAYAGPAKGQPMQGIRTSLVLLLSAAGPGAVAQSGPATLGTTPPLSPPPGARVTIITPP